MEENEKEWVFRLYVAGNTYRSQLALTNLRKYCEQYLPGIHKIEVVDLLVFPEHAALNQITAVPTLIRLSPLPVRKVIGDLSDEDKVVAKLNILPSGS